MPTLKALTAPLLDSSYRLLFEHNPMPMWVYEVQTLRTLAVNAAARAAYGYTAQELTKLTVLDVHPAHDAPRAQVFLSLPVAAQSAQRWQHQRRNGEVFDVDIVSSAFENGGAPARLLLLREVTAQVQASTEAPPTQAQLAHVTQQLSAQESAFIQRLAQLLHDQLGQTIAAVRMAHDTIVTLQGNSVPAPVLRLQTHMGVLIGKAVHQVRRVLLDLHPPLLQAQGLAAALDNELRNRARIHPDTRITKHIDCEPAARRWSSELEYAAFMVAREAIDNALHHCGASHMALHLTGTASDLTLEILDNGAALTDEATYQEGRLSTQDMLERAHAVGASITVTPGTPTGTHVRFHWRSAP